jgi:hypothetical protein
MNLFLNITIVLVLWVIHYIVSNLKDATYYEKDLNSEQNEFKPEKLTEVLDDQGKLKLSGWGRSSTKLSFNPNKINPSNSPFSFLNKLRYKKWEAFGIVHEDIIIGTAIFDISYAGGYFVHFSDMSEKNGITAVEVLDFFNKPNIQDDCSVNCFTNYRIKDSLKYDQHTIEDAKKDLLYFKLNTTEIQLEIDLVFDKDESDNLVTLTPISYDTTLFYYNSKRYLLPARGKIVVNGKTYSGDKFYIANDSGRGVWPVRSGWKWVSASGKTKNGRPFALNLGHGFNHPEASRHTEDCFFVDNRLFKLEATTMEKRFDKKGDEEWVFKSEVSDKIKNKCYIVFKTMKMKNDFMDNILIKTLIKFDLRYGAYSGICVDENEEIHEFENVYGILEDKLSLW